MVNWVKSHKFGILLFVLVFWLVLGQFDTFKSSLPTSSREGFGSSSGSLSLAPSMGLDSLDMAGSSTKMGLTREADFTPQTNQQNRMVIQNSSLSLLVTDVIKVRNDIISYTQSLGGYMVNSDTSNPEDAPNGSITVRVPANKLDEALEVFRKMSVKVVSENLVGYDVTDQYIDIEKRIEQYERTLARYEDLLDRASLVSDITNLTQQIISTQTQIDSLKGQQESLSKNAELAKVTMYLSTDEIALPYTPNETFRPNVIFKMAVRSLIGNLRDFGEFAIWAGVYSVIWVPVLLLFWAFTKWQKKRNFTSK